jgi:hypothetical protein
VNHKSPASNTRFTLQGNEVVQYLKLCHPKFIGHNVTQITHMSGPIPLTPVRAVEGIEMRACRCTVCPLNGILVDVEPVMPRR